jgi:hypothetical protein
VKPLQARERRRLYCMTAGDLEHRSASGIPFTPNGARKVAVEGSIVTITLFEIAPLARIITAVDPSVSS